VSQDGAGAAPDRVGQEIPGAGAAQLPGGGAGGLRGCRGVGGRQRVGPVEQRAAQGEVVAVPGGEPGGATVRVRPPRATARIAA
jgi:hypothetical protein